MNEKEVVYQPYTGGPLNEGEYLLKIRPKKQANYMDSLPTGFMTKLNVDGSIPKPFRTWTGLGRNEECPLPTYVIKETPRSGWKIHSYRAGVSQEWAVMVHPDGFLLEIYLRSLIEVIKVNTVINGTIKGKLRWHKNNLSK